MSKEKRQFDMGIMSEARLSQSLLTRLNIANGGAANTQHIPDEVFDKLVASVESVYINDQQPDSIVARKVFTDPLTWRKPNTTKIIIH